MSFIDRFLDWSHQCLSENDEAQAYLLGRGISTEQWTRHRIGFTGGDFDVDPSADPGHGDACSDRDAKHLHCDSCHYRNWSSEWEGEDGGPKERIVGRRISNSVVFPLTSYSGVCVGFQIRSLVEKSYDTFIIRRRPEGFFFGTSAAIESIWATKEVFLVEGPPDQQIFERLVAPNVLALTTSAVSQSHIRFLRRFVRTVNLVLDLDKAGRDGVKSFLTHYEFEFLVRDIKYPKVRPKDKDPGDLWKSWGDDKFRSYFSNIQQSW